MKRAFWITVIAIALLLLAAVGMVARASTGPLDARAGRAASERSSRHELGEDAATPAVAPRGPLRRRSRARPATRRCGYPHPQTPACRIAVSLPAGASLRRRSTIQTPPSGESERLRQCHP